MNFILIAVIVLGAIGLIAAIVLFAASKMKFIITLICFSYYNLLIFQVK